MTATKIDFKRLLHDHYSAARKPALVDVPELSFLMIDGHGDPNTSPEYREAVEALFSVSYTLKFTLKRAPGGIDYGVMPLEGLWWSDDESDFATANKARWDWSAMIMQPDAVTGELVAAAIETATTRRPLAAAAKLRLEHFHEGLSAQVMYVGPYAEEGPTIAGLHEFIAEQGLPLSGKHHEIYLGDPRRLAPEKLRTIIRQPVATA